MCDENGTDGVSPELFFHTTPEEMHTTALQYGLEKRKIWERSSYASAL